MSGPWLYSAVDQALASETNPIQKSGRPASNNAAKSPIPVMFTGWREMRLKEVLSVIYVHEYLNYRPQLT